MKKVPTGGNSQDADQDVFITQSIQQWAAARNVNKETIKVIEKYYKAGHGKKKKQNKKKQEQIIIFILF